MEPEQAVADTASTEIPLAADPVQPPATIPEPTTKDPPAVEVADEKPSEPASTNVTPAETSPPAAAEKVEKPDPPPPEVAGLKKLTPDYDVWTDPQKKRVLVAGRIVRQEGQLEMFACLKNSKEHESVVAVNSKAFVINAALIALGATPGTPVQFRPEFKPANGPEVEVTVIWTDAEGKRRTARAQEWIRHIQTGKQLEQPWVFGGSGFWVDEATGQQHFMAEDGDFICISNFNSAMLDLPVESSQASSDLQFEAFTERIPPVKTPVLLVLAPKLKKPEKPAETRSE